MGRECWISRKFSTPMIGDRVASRVYRSAVLAIAATVSLADLSTANVHQEAVNRARLHALARREKNAKAAPTETHGSYFNGFGFALQQITRVTSAWLSQTVKSLLREDSNNASASAVKKNLYPSDPRKPQNLLIGADNGPRLLLFCCVIALVIVFVAFRHLCSPSHSTVDTTDATEETVEESCSQSNRASASISRHPMVLRRRPVRAAQ